MTPGIPFYSEVNTAFDVLGFTGVAGYSFTDATAAGLTFLINEDPDGTLDWEVVDGGDWNSGELIALFFESTLPPGYGDYNAINGTVGTATSYAPIREEVPAPASLLLFGTALLGFMGMRRSKIH